MINTVFYKTMIKYTPTWDSPSFSGWNISLTKDKGVRTISTKEGYGGWEGRPVYRYYVR